MKKPSISLTRFLPVLLFSGCTFVWAEGDPEPAPRRVTTTPDAGMQQGDAGGASDGEAGSPAVLPGGGAGGTTGGQGGAVGEDPAGGSGGAPVIIEGLGEACETATTCSDTAPACPAAAGFCTFYCDEAWVNGWRAVESKVLRCQEQGGECTPVGEERSYCVP